MRRPIISISLFATRSRQVDPFLLTVCATSASIPMSCATVAINLVADSESGTLDGHLQWSMTPWQPELSALAAATGSPEAERTKFLKNKSPAAAFAAAVNLPPPRMRASEQPSPSSAPMNPYGLWRPNLTISLPRA